MSILAFRPFSACTHICPFHDHVDFIPAWILTRFISLTFMLVRSSLIPSPLPFSLRRLVRILRQWSRRKERAIIVGGFPSRHNSSVKNRQLFNTWLYYWRYEHGNLLLSEDDDGPNGAVDELGVQGQHDPNVLFLGRRSIVLTDQMTTTGTGQNALVLDRDVLEQRKTYIVQLDVTDKGRCLVPVSLPLTLDLLPWKDTTFT